MQVSVLEGYRTPKSGHHRSKKGHGKRRGRSSFGAAARACAAKGNKPGTKSFGSCMRTALKK